MLWQSRLRQRNLPDSHYHYDGDSHYHYDGDSHYHYDAYVHTEWRYLQPRRHSVL